MIVAKFGGALLNDADGVRGVCREIRALGQPCLVVVSAFSNVTNLLERLAAAAVSDGVRARDLLRTFYGRHEEIAGELLPAAELEAWHRTVEPLLERLDEVVRGLGIVGELSPRTLDLIVHFGERFSSSIVTAALSADGEVPAPNALSALDLLITDDAHRYARPDLTLTRERVELRLRPLLTHAGLVITEGYIARGTSGEVTTMGRESSDYSATLLAEMLGADQVRLYAGVPGILTADPREVEGARTIPRMSYRMARTLAELGAKILHPRTVTPVERGNIPLIITDIAGHSTRIEASGDEGCSVVFLPEAGVVDAETSAAGTGVEGFITALSGVVPVVWHHRFRSRLQVVTALRLPRRSMPVHLLSTARDPELVPAAVVSLVKETILPGRMLERFFTVLGDHEPLAVQGGIDRRSVSVALHPDHAQEFVRRLHAEVVPARSEDKIG